jgi:hypothetical protein
VNGYVAAGSSEALLHGLATARRMLPTACVYACDQAHYSVRRACELLRIPLVTVASTPEGTMDPADLRLQVLQRRWANDSSRAPTSPAEAPPMVSWPTGRSTASASFKIGISSPRDVATNAVPISNGLSTSPARFSTQPTAPASANVPARPTTTSRPRGPAQLLDIDFQPGKEQQETQSHDRQRLNHGVRPHDIQHRRTEDHTGQDLGDRARKTYTGHQSEEERDAGGYRENDDQVVVRHRDSGGTVCGALATTHVALISPRRGLPTVPC